LLSYLIQSFFDSAVLVRRLFNRDIDIDQFASQSKCYVLCLSRDDMVACFQVSNSCACIYKQPKIKIQKHNKTSVDNINENNKTSVYILSS